MSINYFSLGRRLFRSSLFVLLVTGSFAVAANCESEVTQGNRGETDLSPLVVNLLTWIGENGDYSVAPFLSALPEISFCNRNEEIVYENRSIIMHEPVSGVYDFNENKIVLVKPWSSQNPENVGTLLHELVHFVQYSSKEWVCWHETEWEAYKLQENWLKQNGIDPEFNWTEIFLLSRCSRRDIHP